MSGLSYPLLNSLCDLLGLQKELELYQDCNKSQTQACTNLSVCLHHFHSHVLNKMVTIEHVKMMEQLADIFMKPFPKSQIECLQDHVVLGFRQ